MHNRLASQTLLLVPSNVHHIADEHGYRSTGEIVLISVIFIDGYILRDTIQSKCVEYKHVLQ